MMERQASSTAGSWEPSFGEEEKNAGKMLLLVLGGVRQTTG
jgi:hypothetical protein